MSETIVTDNPANGTIIGSAGFGDPAGEEMEQIMERAREIVHKRLKELGWTSYRLVQEARARGVGRTIVFEWLAGKRDIMLSTFEVICDILGIQTLAVRLPKMAAPDQLASLIEQDRRDREEQRQRRDEAKAARKAGRKRK